MNGTGVVAAGIDTHKDTHALCVIDLVGRAVLTGTFNADADGYEQIAEAIGRHKSTVSRGLGRHGDGGAARPRYRASLTSREVRLRPR